MTMAGNIDGKAIDFDAGDCVMCRSPGGNRPGRVFGYRRLDDRCPDCSDARCPFCPQFDGREVE